MGNLLAVIEFKSQLGSYGNNFNNRAEEAIGSSVDFWMAFRENQFPNHRLQTQGGLYHIEDWGLKIGIGVATGADHVFISSDLIGQIEEELLIPIINGKDLCGNSINWSGLFLFNLYNADGTLIELQKYPKAMAFLLQHEVKLKGRHIAKKNPSRWYRTIDRIYTELRYLPKILLPDMSTNSFIFVNEGAYYPSHNLYYLPIIGGEEKPCN